MANHSFALARIGEEDDTAAPPLIKTKARIKGGCTDLSLRYLTVLGLLP